MINRYLKAQGRWYAAASIALMAAATTITWGMAKENLPRIGFAYVAVCYILVTWLNVILGMKMEKDKSCRS